MGDGMGDAQDHRQEAADRDPQLVDELRRLLNQLRHPTPWSASLEWFPDRDLPEHLKTALVSVDTHQGGTDLILDGDDGDVADLGAKEDAVAIAAVMTFAPTLLDEIERLQGTTAAAVTDNDRRLAQIAEYARRQAAHHEADGMEGLARPWRHVAALATPAPEMPDWGPRSPKETVEPSE